MKTPWHLWVVGIFALLWNAFGALDYVLTRYDVAAYTANMPEGLKEQLAAYPAWMGAVWALAVWLPVLAAFLLLSRHKASAAFFGIGFILVLVAGIYNYGLSDPPLNAVAGNYVLYFWIGVTVIALLEWVYARTMSKRGVLT